MELNKDEFEHITDKLAGAMTRSLQDRIAQLEAEKAELQDLYEQSQKALTVQALALQAAQGRIGQLEDEVSHLRSEQGQQALTSMICAQYIPLSKPATREYVLHLQEGRDVMFVGHFLQHTLPSDVPPQLADEVKRMTCLPEPKSDAPPSVTNNFAAGSSAQVMNGPINNSTFNTPKTE